MMILGVINMIDTKKNIEEFESLYNKYILPRDGGDRLLTFIRQSDFYTAPASTRFHLSEEGGLLQHSLNVYHCLMNKMDNPTWASVLKNNEWEIATVALLHDLCKTYFYEKELKNTKTYDPEIVAKFSANNVKHDAKGDYVWAMLESYTYNNRFPIGHGAKSVFFIQQFMKLSIEEITCIYWHMGAYCGSDQWSELGNAYEKYPLALALHEADMEASHMLEI